MKKPGNLTCFLSLCLLALLTVLPRLHAGPALPCPVTLTQPDGYSFLARLRGDEHLHIMEDEQGHAIVKGEDGYWYYALYASDGSRSAAAFKVGAPAPAHVLSSSRYRPGVALAMEAGLRRKAVQELRQDQLRRKRILRQSGAIEAAPERAPEIKCLILLVQTPDVHFNFGKDKFSDLLNAGNYGYNGACGSAREYFNEMLRGDLSLGFDVEGPFTLDSPMAWYFGNDSRGHDLRPAEAVAEACRKAASAGVDFSRYDNNGDGVVDKVIVFVAGRDEAQYGGDDCVWSHQWYVRSGAGIICNVSGKYIDAYAITTEYGYDVSARQYRFTGIGTFCHEFTHTFGLPDFYDTDGEESGGTASGLFRSFGLMDSGNHNDSGRRPPHYTAIEYDALELGECQPLTLGAQRLEPISRSRRFLKYECPGNPEEYYLFECREDNSVWEKSIGGRGLAIYHIDRSANAAGTHGESPVSASQRWRLNVVNVDPYDQCGYLVSASPGISAYDADGNAMPVQRFVLFPQHGVDSFSPSNGFVFRDGTASPVSITGIRVEGEDVLFNVVRCDVASLPTVEGDSKEVFQDAVILKWSASDNVYDGETSVKWGSKASSMQELKVAPYAPGQYALTLEGLSPRTSYTVSLWFENGEGLISPVKELAFMTKSYVADNLPYIRLSGVARNPDMSFPPGTELPLRVYNAVGAVSVEWFYDGESVSTGPGACFIPERSGVLTAEVSMPDGYSYKISKKINIR